MNKHYFSFHFDSSKKSWAQRMMSLALVVLFAISASVSFAQNESQRTKLVQGTVLDENGEPMRSVTVVPANDTGGTITDSKGVYILKCAETCDSLNFSFIGYKTLTIACKDAQTVRMQLEVLAAEDVVVTVTKNGEVFDYGDITWGSRNVEDKTIGTFTLPAPEDHSGDGHYVITVEYTDRSNNEMVKHVSDTHTIDTTLPVINVEYDDKKMICKIFSDGQGNQEP